MRMGSRAGLKAAVVVAAMAVGLAACSGAGGESDQDGQDEEAPLDPATLLPSGAPSGSPVLPDLVPEPPDVLQMGRGEEGTWSIRFTSVLVNVGEGDFALRGERSGDEWDVEQVISYTDGGAEHVPVDAVMAWGGDGHGHWHVARVASYLLEPAVEPGATGPGSAGRQDAKVGFCFFDYGKELGHGPEEARFRSPGCGEEEAESFLMGLSPGWGDTYDFTLPGQSIDVTDLPDGDYRLWAQADAQGWFREANRDNNLTWVDFELGRLESGARIARVSAVGPRPE